MEAPVWQFMNGSDVPVLVVPIQSLQTCEGWRSWSVDTMKKHTRRYRIDEGVLVLTPWASASTTLFRLLPSTQAPILAMNAACSLQTEPDAKETRFNVQK